VQQREKEFPVPSEILGASDPRSASVAVNDLRERLMALYEGLPAAMDRCHCETDADLQLERAAERVASVLLDLDAALAKLHTALLVSHAVKTRLAPAA
jgi:hypothetical protein